MKVRQAAKRRTRNQARYRITYSPDYDHEVWESTAAPTPQTHRDAFYAHHELVNPRPARKTRRRVPHETLSIGALKKRLYRAGIDARRVAEMARQIHAGPGPDVLTLEGCRVLRWPVEELERRFGKRVARAVRRFVRERLTVLDEGWRFMRSATTADYARSSLLDMRKVNAAPVGISQGIDQLAGVE